MDTVDRRLKVLERELSRSRRINQLLAVSAVVAVCIAGAQGNPLEESSPPTQTPVKAAARSDAAKQSRKDQLHAVEAHQLVLVDRIGRRRVLMQITDDGPALSMFDEEGRKRLELGQTTTASGLRLFDSSEPAVSLQLRNHDDAGQLEIRNAQGAALMKSDGFSVHDATDHRRLQLSLLNGNFPVMGMSQSGQVGPESIEITANESARSLKIHDKNGNPLFSVTSGDSGETALSMHHPAHERSLQISTGPNDLHGPVMAFFAPASEDGTGGLLPRLQLGWSGDRQLNVRVVDGEGKTLFAAPSQ